MRFNSGFKGLTVLSVMNYMHQSRTVMYYGAIATVIMMMTGFWDMTPCALVEIDPSACIFGIALHESYEMNM